MLAGDPNRKSANPIFVYECHRKLGLLDSIVSRCPLNPNMKLINIIDTSRETASTSMIPANTDGYESHHHVRV